MFVVVEYWKSSVSAILSAILPPVAVSSVQNVPPTAVSMSVVSRVSIMPFSPLPMSACSAFALILKA